MYSPAAIENAPASKPASPANAIAVLAAPEPAKPITSELLDTRPSLTPNTAARRAPERSPRCQRSAFLIPLGSSVFRSRVRTRAWERSSTALAAPRRRRLRPPFVQAGGGVLGAHKIGQHGVDGEPASQPGQRRGSQTGRLGGWHRLAPVCGVCGPVWGVGVCPTP